MRRAAKTDGNQPEIVKALESAGCTVQSLAAVGCGVPDLLVSRGAKNYLIEVKDPAQVPSKRRLTPAQVEWHKRWTGQIAVVETVDEALAVVRKP